MKHTFGVVIGRFQPIHDGHVEIIKHAASQCENVIVLVGSPNRARTFKNPLTFKEREFLIKESLRDFNISNLRIEPIDDYPYNDAAWVSGIQSKVDEVVESVNLSNVRPEITIYGHDKDDSTYYLNLFPKWKVERLPLFHDVSATQIREDLYENRRLQYVNPTVSRYMTEFVQSEDGQNVKNEYHFIQRYKTQFDTLPYKPIFSTTDAVIYYKGYILMVIRKGYPGKGQWALPGGFLEANMRIKDSMVKEVKEETSIRVSKSILFGNLRKIEVFDDPSRSLRGRTVTHCGLIVLDPVTSIQTLPVVRGGDDASHARWVSLNEIENMKTNIFEDHYFIIKQMLNMT